MMRDGEGTLEPENTVGGYEISADGKKMLVQKDGKYAIIDLPKGPITIGESLNLSGLEVQLDRRAEWKQMFDEYLERRAARLADETNDEGRELLGNRRMAGTSDAEE